MRDYNTRLAFMFILALATSALVIFLLLNFAWLSSLMPFGLEHTGTKLGLFALNFILIFDLLILVIENDFTRQKIKKSLKRTPV